MPLLGGPNLPSVSWLAMMTGNIIPGPEVTSAPGIPDLQASSDTGDSDTDNLTNDETPSFRTTLPPEAVATDTFRLFRASNVEIGNKVLDATDISNGFVDVTSSALPGGINSITARVENVAGLSPASNARVINVDTVAPDAPTLDLLASSDSGSSSTDNITNDQTPTFRITFVGNTVAGDLAELREGTNVLASKTLDAGDISAGFVDLTSSLLTENTYSVTARLTDDAGNVSSNSNTVSTTIDITATSAPSIDLLSTSDSGVSDTDNITQFDQPTFDILLPIEAVEGDRIQLRQGVNVVNETTLTAQNIIDGNVELAPATPLSDATHSMTARCIDIAGNVSADSSAINVTVDTQAPSPPTDIVVTPAQQGTGPLQTNNTQPTFRVTLPGDAVSGDQVQLRVNGLFETAVVLTGTDISNTFVDIQSANVLANNTTHSISARVNDIAGNMGNAASAVEVTIGTITNVPGVLFNGATSFQQFNTAPTGIVDSTSFELSFGFSVAGSAGTRRTILCVGSFVTDETDYGLLVEIDNNNVLRAVGHDSAGNQVFQCLTTATFSPPVFPDPTVKHHARLVVNGNVATIEIDGVSDTNNTPGTNAAIVLEDQWLWGKQDDPSNPNFFDGELAERVASNSPATSVGRYYDTVNNLFRQLGSYGANKPCYLKHNAANATVNSGSGQALDDAVSISDGDDFGAYGSLFGSVADISWTDSEEIPNNTSFYNYGAQNVGADDPSRYIIFGLHSSAGTTPQISGADFNAVAVPPEDILSLFKNVRNQGVFRSPLYPTGATADFIGRTSANMVNQGLEVLRLVGANPEPVETYELVGNESTPIVQTINVPVNGCFAIFATGGGTGEDITFTNATRRDQNLNETSVTRAVACDNVPAGGSIEVTIQNVVAGNLIASILVFGPEA